MGLVPGLKALIQMKNTQAIGSSKLKSLTVSKIDNLGVKFMAMEYTHIVMGPNMKENSKNSKSMGKALK